MTAPWSTHALGDLFEIARGGSPRPIEKFITDDLEGLNWVKIGDATASGRYIDRTKEKIRPEGLSKTRQVYRGDFLLTNSMSFGRPYIMATDGCIHDGWLLLRPRDDRLIDRGYFYHLLSSPRIYAQFASRASGATVKNLNTEIVSGVRVQLPPLDEQQRIAAILDKADALRQKRKRAIALLDSLAQSIFLEMFETENSGWARPTLSEVAVIDARMVDPRTDRYANLLHYGPDRIEKDTGRLLPALTARQDGLVSGKFLCNKDHILYSKIRPYLNKVALCKEECLCSADVYPVTPQKGVVDRIFLWFVLRSKDFLAYTASCSNRANIPKLNRKQFLEYQLSLPPLELQEAFSDRLRAVLARAATQERQMDRIEKLFAALQHQAFSGQLA